MLANIDSELSTIQNGRYGEDIRTAIKDAIYKVNNAGYMPVVENLNVVENGTYTPSAGVNGFSKVVVNVPGGGGYPEPTGTISITENGTVNVKDYASANVNVQPNLQSKTVTENGTVTPDSGYDGLSSVVVDVSGGGSNIRGFELYAADGDGGARLNQGLMDNQYFVCYFDDNMSSTYTLNGQSYTFSTIATGKQQTLATTKSVSGNTTTGLNAIVSNGSVFTASHGDNGSYISVVGGWVGYPSGDTIYENAATGTSNSITLNSAHDMLLVFIGGCFNTDGVTSVEINGVTYTISNIGYHYGAYGVYGAIVIENNTDTVITATFTQSGWNYMSIIGIDG